MRMTTKRLLTAALTGLAVTAAAACSSPSVSAPPAGHTSAAAPGATSAQGAAPSAPAAASSAGSSAAGSNTSVPSASTSYCSHAPASMIDATLGLTVGKLVPVIDGPVAVCAYTGKYEVIVRFQVNENASQFGQDQKSTVSGQTVAAVTGLGDGAFSATTHGHPPTLYTLAARKGTVAVFITSPASLTAERTLMTRVLAQL